jgi:hypothetical protein
MYLDGTKLVDEEETNPNEYHDSNESENRAKKRAIAIDKVKSSVAFILPGMSKEEKQIKLELCNKVFNTVSWVEVENLDLDRIENGVELLDCWRRKAERHIIDRKDDGYDGPDYDELKNLISICREEINMPESGGIEEAIK